MHEPKVLPGRLPVIEAAHPIALATAMARERGATLLIGPSATEQAARELRRRAGTSSVDVGAVRAAAAELLDVRRILAKTERRLAETPAEVRTPVRDAPSHRSTAVTAAVVLVAVVVLLAAAASTLGAHPLVWLVPALAALLATLVVLSGRRHRRPSPAPTVAPPSSAAAHRSATAIAATVARSHEARWIEVWEELDRTAPDPAQVDNALAELDADDAIDLRDPPQPLVVATPCFGTTTERAREICDLLAGLDPRLLLAVVVEDASVLPTSANGHPGSSAPHPVDER